MVAGLSTGFARILRNDRAVADAATSAIRELATHSDGYHRGPITDALIAAAAPNTAGSPCSTATRTSIGSPRPSPSRASSSQEHNPSARYA
jgi:hypothetical protein